MGYGSEHTHIPKSSETLLREGREMPQVSKVNQQPLKGWGNSFHVPFLPCRSSSWPLPALGSLGREVPKTVP